MRILVAIANHGFANAKYLSAVLDQWRAMPYDVRLVVLSDVPKELGRDVEVRVGAPGRNPWSLPFAHRRLFCERAHEHDLFVYSEDDTPISERNLEAFLETTAVLPPDEIAGFLRVEVDPSGGAHYSTVHSHYHWDPASVCHRGGLAFAHFTNEHAAAYVLTREQLAHARASGGFEVPPHEGRYDMLCAAATDPYTQCGMRKLICLSRLEDFRLRHLSDRYLGRMGLAEDAFQAQCQALLDVARGALPAGELLRTETRLPHGRLSKSYYEAVQQDLLDAVPADARSVLSLGCGWGATEEALAKRGARVTGVPLDAVIGALAARRNVEIVHGGWEGAWEALSHRRFDALVLSNLLHLLPDATEWLRRFSLLVHPGGVVAASAPNLAQIPFRLRRLTRDSRWAGLSDPGRCGVTRVDGARIRRLFATAGLTDVHLRYAAPARPGLARVLATSAARLGSWISPHLCATGSRPERPR